MCNWGRIEPDLADLPEEVRSTLVHPCDELGQVLALTLRGASFREGRLRFSDDVTVEPVTVSTVEDEPGNLVAH